MPLPIARAGHYRCCCAREGDFSDVASALAVVAAGAVALAADAPERPPREAPSSDRCRLGQAPGPPYSERPPEGSLRYRKPPIVIGCGRLPSGRDFDLVGYRLGRSKRGSLCLDVHYPESGESSGCGSDRVRGGGAIDATGVSRAAGRPATVTGATRGFVKRVTMRYELRGKMRASRAALVIVRNRDLLRAIGVEKPFGAYLGEVPPNSRAVSAQARDAKGHLVGVGYPEGFAGPIGEGRICHGRPRVSKSSPHRPRPGWTTKHRPLRRPIPRRHDRLGGGQG